MNRLILLFLALSSLLSSSICSGQRLKVATFEIQPKDLSARTDPRADNSGQLCALLKIYVMDKITEVQGNVMGDIVDKGVEKWVYVSDHTKQIKLNFEKHFPLMITFSDYDYPTVSEQMVYVIELEDANGVKNSANNIYDPAEDTATVKESTAANEVMTVKQPTNDASRETTETLEKAKKAYNEQEYDKAFWLFMKVNMNPEAQNYLGQMYFYGYAVAQDRAKAFELYSKSADQGFAAAQSNLAGMYLYGERKVVKANVKKALELYHKAAEQDDLYAQYTLGWMYSTGTNVKKNVDEGVKWYRRAAAHQPPSTLSEMAQDALKGLGY
ncbi:MAG: sel1 repeat family protein [Muribaculaceae bacterium]|nr:sel1 repeat family protein [Muribaculaceae bacterium]